MLFFKILWGSGSMRLLSVRGLLALELRVQGLVEGSLSEGLGLTRRVLKTFGKLKM